MTNNSQSKALLIIGIVLIVIGSFYLFNFKKTTSTPQVLIPSPQSYNPGTTISLYKSAPSGFPAEIILENKALTYSGVVTSVDGKTQTTVSYKSDKNVSDVLSLYEMTLPKMGWQIFVNSVSPKISPTVAVFHTTKGDVNIFVTVAQIGSTPSTGSLVTFQYKK